MLEVLLTREDANTEFALLAEWLMADESTVAARDVVCVIETTKATVEVEAPGAGTIVHLFAAGAEVELGAAVALVAESDAELLEARARASSAAQEPAGDGARATRKARELATRHGIDLATIDKRGFITAADVEALASSEDGRGSGVEGRGEDALLAGVSTDEVTLPASWHDDPARGVVDPAFLERLRTQPGEFVGLSSAEKCAAYREHGAEIGEGVELGEGSLVIAGRLVVEDGVQFGARARVDCAEAFCVGAVTHIGPDFELGCRRAFLGANIHAGRSVRIGGGGRRDPWAILAIGERAYLGDEIFINVCRPVLIGRETFVTQRSMIVTHNIGHSLLEGFENRFAPVVVEDYAQIGLGAVVYAGCRIGERAIVASNSYVVSDIPAGKLAIGVPARPAGDVQVRLSDERRAELAHQMLDELCELLALRGHAVEWIETDGARCFRVDSPLASGRVALAENLAGSDGLPAPAADGESVVLALNVAKLASGWATLDLLAHEVHGEPGVLLDSVREFCRKRGIRFGVAPWRYSSGLV